MDSNSFKNKYYQNPELMETTSSMKQLINNNQYKKQTYQQNEYFIENENDLKKKQDANDN